MTPEMAHSFPHRALSPALCLLLVVLALALSTRPASSAAANVTVSLSVASHSQVAGCSAGPAIRFGVVLPGTIAAPAADCTVTFGSSNDTSMLRAWQTDDSGNAMFRMTKGTLDPGWDASVGGNGQFTVSGQLNLSWDITRPQVKLQPGSNRIIVAYRRSSNAINVVRFEEDGDLDPTFGVAGRFSDASINYASMNAMTVGPDGSIYLASRDGWSPYD